MQAAQTTDLPDLSDGDGLARWCNRNGYEMVVERPAGADPARPHELVVVVPRKRAQGEVRQ